MEEESTLVKRSDSIQKKNSFTKVKETRKCSLNGEVKASEHDQVSIDEAILILKSNINHFGFRMVLNSSFIKNIFSFTTGDQAILKERNQMKRSYQENPPFLVF